jgi:para-aminobenzoate synthetase
VRLPGKELGHAGLEAGEVGVELDRAAVDDQQGLEDALLWVGAAGIGHAAIVATSRGLKTLLIDNYDSFTYNLFQLLAEVNGEEPTVVRNDEASWDELSELELDNVVISPGPGRPDRVDDFGVCDEAIRQSTVPLLGVCLGHQGLGALHGAAVVSAPEPFHGRLSAVLHDDSPLFAGIPREFQAVRYHSLCVEQPLPDELHGIAWTTDGVLMALEHRDRPLWGVQFHPESICTEHGRRLIENFRKLSEGERRGHPRTGGYSERPATRPSIPNPASEPAASPGGGVPVAPTRHLVVRRIDGLADAEQAFVSLYGESENAFWLDSSRLGDGARFSFIGDDSGPRGAAVSYDVGTKELRVERDGEVELRRESIFEYLANELARPVHDGPELPFEFDCGFVGWLGYELKAECGGDAAHKSSLPDAALIFADRMIAFDHAEGCVYLLCLAEADATEDAEGWLSDAAERLASLPPLDERAGSAGDSVEFRLARSRERYLEEIAECQRLLGEGETYEICLTNSVLADAAPDPLQLYRALRRVNPAPFSSFVRFGGTAVLSSSPERFLRVGRDRWAEAKPIKGTSRRGETAAEDVRLAERLRGDEKNRAENLMIADLLRNDLGSVCGVGTVHVPSLMQVESYETVHQLVTTVRGLLREGLGPVDCARACFPPGSMTGAPKLRTMRIVDGLEGEARGVYSGAIGYFGLGGGCDLSVAIRTIVLDGDSARIGAGGAIVTLSGVEDEYEEMLLKASAPLRAFDPAATIDPFSATTGSGSAPRSPA